MKKKVMLIIMDGLGAAPKSKGNPVSLANPKNLGLFWNTYSHTYLLASGEAVGLPSGVKGNSEVGHLNIGSGRVISQNLPRINRAIEKGVYKSNSTLWDALKHTIKYKSRIHLMGCLSDGSVHSHINHFKATLDFFSFNNYTGEIFVHAFTDGRDTPVDSSKKYFSSLQEHMDKIGVGKFASVIGRYLAMDRNQTWDRTRQAYDMLVNGIGNRYNSWEEAIDTAWHQGKTDEFISPSIINTGSDSKILDNDVVLFLNYRADRALQLTNAIIDTDFDKFQTKKFRNLFFASMVEYRKGYPKNVIFPKDYVSLPLGKVVAEENLRQLRIAESEKFPHVTYFFNGGTSIKFQGEDRVEIQSPKVATYDLAPEMSAMKILEVLSSRISTDIYDLIILNLANPDMVGHTGNLLASIKAVEVVDYVVYELTKKFVARGGAVIITADHGNVEELINIKTGEIDTEHSINPVPMIVVEGNKIQRTLPYGSLKDIAPTILDLMGIPQPSEMTGKSLLPINDF